MTGGEVVAIALASVSIVVSLIAITRLASAHREQRSAAHQRLDRGTAASIRADDADLEVSLRGVEVFHGPSNEDER